MKEPKFSPDMRNIEFGADRERQLDALADASNGMTIDPESGEQYLSAQLAAQLMTFLRRRWLKMLALQIAITVPVTGAIMFTQYQPGGPLDSPTFMTCLLMLAAASLSVGICGFASLDPDAHSRQQLLAIGVGAPYFPLAGLLGWSVCCYLFWRFLHGWAIDTGRFFVANPFGLFILCWALSLLLLPFAIMPVAEWWARRQLKRAKVSTVC